jgi:hypothetical protein
MGRRARARPHPPEPLRQDVPGFPDFGLALINPDPAGGGSYAFVRFPVRRFRPAQADMLHFDLWTADGENLLIDAGTSATPTTMV